ncbi:MAG TPA: division/cell wall cluster transcriptional repressor MraZ [Byssovorax sp.]|jgi:MraZ protein
MSTMFRGQFEHAIDAKGRTSFPSRFRELLSAASDTRVILTPALFDRCLHLYPLRAWEELEAKIAEMPQFDQNVVLFRRRYLSAAVECDIDRSGRVLVPPSLREHADLEKSVVWAGMGKTAELWSATHWRAGQALESLDLEKFKAAIADQFRL